MAVKRKEKKPELVKEKQNSENNVVEKVQVVVPVVEKRVYRWKKLGGGSLRFAGKIIKPNEIFISTKEDIPAAFLDLLECLDDVGFKAELSKEKVEKNTPPEVYELKSAGEDLWNVVNPYGKVVNPKPLSLDSAQELKKVLEA